MIARRDFTLIVALAAFSIPAIAQSLPNAFSEGSALGRAGNASARSRITEDAARLTVPHFNASPPEASYFGAPGLSTQATAKTAACAEAARVLGSPDPSCAAVEFSQTNPAKRPAFAIGTTDPLITRAKTITADPQAIAGNLAGTYSGCTVETVKRPDIFETQLCHQYRTLENATCDKVLIVTPVLTPGCTPGQFLTRVTADPCPACIDYLAYDFGCGANTYSMHVFTVEKASGATYIDLGNLTVPGTLNTEIGQTAGPSQISGLYCYQTYYSQSCSGTNCTISTWFYNPCQGTSFVGASTFAMPTTVSFADTWDNQCAALEARAK